MRPSRDDVVACYRRILGREPENEQVIELQLRVADDFWALVMNFIRSDEFAAVSGKRSVHSLLKSLDENYLARGLSRQTRMACAIHNYAALQRILKADILVALMERGLPILDGAPTHERLHVDMLLFAGPANEGEISLILSVANRRVAVLTFTIVPAAEFGLPPGDAFLISRLQGYIGAGEDAREVSRRFGDISPHYMLMAILEGVATASAVRSIIGVTARTHPAYKESREAILAGAYDRMFGSLGSRPLPSGLQVMAVPRDPSPLGGIAAGHRARTRRKRERKQALSDAVDRRWRSYMRPPEPA